MIEINDINIPSIPFILKFKIDIFPYEDAYPQTKLIWKSQ